MFPLALYSFCIMMIIPCVSLCCAWLPPRPVLLVECLSRLCIVFSLRAPQSYASKMTSASPQVAYHCAVVVHMPTCSALLWRTRIILCRVHPATPAALASAPEKTELWHMVAV